jgi:hypothetical protein
MNRIAIVIASTGRPVELGRWVDHVRRQTVQPASLVYAVANAADLPSGNVENVKVLICDVGSCHQRNVGLSSVIESSDIVAFFDDDYVPSSYCVEGIDAFFRDHPDVVAANGMLLADGVNSPGISYDDAKELVARHDNLQRTDGGIVHELSGFGQFPLYWRGRTVILAGTNRLLLKVARSFRS